MPYRALSAFALDSCEYSRGMGESLRRCPQAVTSIGFWVIRWAQGECHAADRAGIRRRWRWPYKGEIGRHANRCLLRRWVPLPAQLAAYLPKKVPHREGNGAAK